MFNLVTAVLLASLLIWTELALRGPHDSLTTFYLTEALQVGSKKEYSPNTGLHSMWEVNRGFFLVSILLSSFSAKVWICWQFYEQCICHRYFWMRASHIQQVADKLHYPCRNAHMGCTDTLRLLYKDEHEANCAYRSYRCKMVPPCEWKGQHRDILPHVMLSHSDTLLQGPEHVSICTRVSTAVRSCLIYEYLHACSCCCYHTDRHNHIVLYRQLVVCSTCLMLRIHFVSVCAVWGGVTWCDVWRVTWWIMWCDAVC